MRIKLAVLVALAVTASTAQTPVQPGFELMLPDIGRVIPGGTNVVADIPLRQITRVTIQVLGSADANLTYGDLRVRINGKGTRNVFDSGSNARGKYLAMSAATLRMRRDEIFDRSENTIEIYGKDKRGREYYQNWILRVVDDKANPWFTWISSMSPLDETGVPPDLALDQPSAPVLFTSAAKSMSIRLKGQASAASGISSLSINGSAVSVAKSPSVSFDQNYVLARGNTAIAVETLDGKGNKRNVTIPVIYPRPAAPPARFAGQTWAVAIGVSRFDAKQGAPPPLPQAAFDVKALASQLSARGVKPENMLVLADEQATADKVRIGLGDFVAKAKPEDLLLVYWSTQGLHDPASPDKVYLGTADTQMLHLADTAIEISELQLLLERSVRSRHALLFFDADHPLGQEWGFQGRSIVSTHLLNLFDEQLGRSVLVSGAEDDKAGRSAFSTALLAALGGKADVDQNGVLTPHEICSYVTEEVRKATGGNQLPRALLAKQDEQSSILALK